MRTNITIGVEECGAAVAKQVGGQKSYGCLRRDDRNDTRMNERMSKILQYPW